MPEVVVYILEGRTLEQKRGLVKDITAAVVKNAGVPIESVTVSLVETAKTDEGQRRRAVQRDGPALASVRSQFSTAPAAAGRGCGYFGACKILVSALHNFLAAMR